MCAHFVRSEGVLQAITIYTVGFMMMLRIKALYPEQRWIPWLLSSYILLEVSVRSYLLVHGIPVVHNPNSGVVACTIVYSESISDVASSSIAWLPLIYDFVILGLTLYRTIPFNKDRHSGVLLKRIMQDGILYFVVIFGLAFTLTFMIIFAPAGVKNIIGQTEALVTVTMMSRITLNLKKAGSQTTTYTVNSRGIEAIPMSIAGDITTLHERRPIFHLDPPAPVYTGYDRFRDTETALEEFLVPEGQKVRRANFATE